MSHRHFRPLSTSWKYDREDQLAFDPAVHERDPALSSALGRVDWKR